jgi:hypothetical protein
MKLPNRNQLLLIVGLIVAEGPDVAAVASWLSGLGIPHLAKLVHFLGWLSTALGSAALAWPAIRAKLALLGLATPPGAQAPWNPSRDNVAPMIRVARTPDPGSVTVPVSRLDDDTPVLPRKTK